MAALPTGAPRSRGSGVLRVRANWLRGVTLDLGGQGAGNASCAPTRAHEAAQLLGGLLPIWRPRGGARQDSVVVLVPGTSVDVAKEPSRDLRAVTPRVSDLSRVGLVPITRFVITTTSYAKEIAAKPTMRRSSDTKGLRVPFKAFGICLRRRQSRPSGGGGGYAYEAVDRYG